MADGTPVTYEDLTEELKKKYDEVKAILEADLIGSFHRTRSHGIRWKGFSPEGALDGVDCPPRRRTHQEIMRHQSPSGPALETYQGEMPLQSRPPLPFALAAPGPPAYVVYKIGGDPSDYRSCTRRLRRSLTGEAVEVTRRPQNPHGRAERKAIRKWHNSLSHTTNDCRVWRQQIQMAIEQGRLIFNQYAMKVDTHPFPAVNMVECTYPGGCQPSFSFNINMVGLGHHSWDGDEVEVVHADDSSEISTAGMNAWESAGQEPLSGINLDDCERIDVTKDGVRLVLSTGLTV
ncbi:hypothetical protein QYE76_024562 [Lolium multiflorum]|uniref:Uncharacterized protein n=1 Tax=Lolium multiflorum TaxID=4521 RepID=A0AAD8RDW7_LOLMU|nr:hypothetical protein QYE76_024562 [Lolium multiflorum]